MDWYLKCLHQYADFSGRARRTEYWMFVLFNLIFFIAAMILDNVLGLTPGGLPYGLFYFLYGLAVLIPGLAVVVRRLHDIGKSGWMILITLIPIVGGIWLLVLMMLDSSPGDNEYGPNPKDVYDEGTESSETSNDLILLLVVIWMLFSRIFWAIMSKHFDNFFTLGWFKPVNVLFNFIWGIIPIGLAFIVKDKTKRIVLFILGGIYLAFQFYDSVMVFVR